MSSMNIQESFNKLSLGEKIVLIASPLFFIDSFLPWFDYDIAGFDGPSRSGWSGDMSFLSILAVFAALAMGGVIVATKFLNVKLPALPQGVSWGMVHLGLGAYVAFAVLIRLVIGESAGPFDADMAFGIFLAVPIAAALVGGGFLMFQAERSGGGAGAM